LVIASEVLIDTESRVNLKKCFSMPILNSKLLRTFQIGALTGNIFVIHSVITATLRAR
jgi:hypothetical protein